MFYQPFFRSLQNDILQGFSVKILKSQKTLCFCLSFQIFNELFAELKVYGNEFFKDKRGIERLQKAKNSAAAQKLKLSGKASCSIANPELSTMDKHQSLALRLELIWWVATLLVAAGVLYPILTRVQYYPFTFDNALYIITFITVTRYIFLLRHTFLARRQVLKLVLIFLFLPFIFYQVQQLNYFQTFLDEQGFDTLIGNLPLAQRDGMARFIHSQMLLFGVGSIISSVLFPLRLIVSVWRTRNLNTV